MSLKDYYRILGVSGNDSAEDIRKIFRRLAHRHHPDKHVSAAEENDLMKKKLNLVYGLLLDYRVYYKYSFREADVAKSYPHMEDMRM